jgi:O-ureido-D-serine cyclo-ligase
VDIARNAAGTPCIVELELTEPSLFFEYAPGSAERFAQAITSWLQQAPTRRPHV